MSQALYRKYRPQDFESVVDQNHIKITLQNEILTGQIAHAYLFAGPHGVGKTTLARILAKALNCQNRKDNQFEPCNKCASCESINAGKNLDLIEIDAATHTQVDKVRENIIENVRFAPHGSRYKIFIIDEVHMLSTQAFNALLKTLEEPPAHILFILCTTETYKLPETIISRCQKFDFKKVPADKIKAKLEKMAKLEKVKIADEVLSLIALRSGGFMRDAESQLGQIITLSDKNKEITFEQVEPILPRSNFESTESLITALKNKNSAEAIEIINNLISDGIDLERFNLDCIEYLRKIILAKLNLSAKDPSLSALPKKIKENIISHSETFEFSKLTLMIEKLILAQPKIKNSEITQLPLEIAVIEICLDNSVQNTPSISTPQKPANIESTEKTQKTQKNQSPQKNSEPSVIARNTSTKNPETKPVKKSINTNIEEIKKIWPKFLKTVQQTNHSLPVILQSSMPFKLNDNSLEIAFQYDLHVTRLKDKKCCELAEQTLSKILNSEIIIKPILLPTDKQEEFKNFLTQLKNNSSAPEDAIDLEHAKNSMNKLLEDFGGKIIE